MVAISLYRGNLHRVPDVPRRWNMPIRKISLKDFRSLMNRRSKALSRLRSSTAIATTSNPNPYPNSNQTPIEPVSEPDKPNNPREGEEEGGALKAPAASVEIKREGGLEVGECSGKAPAASVEIKCEGGLEVGECFGKPCEVSGSLAGGKKPEVAEKGCQVDNGGVILRDVKVEQPEELANLNTETTGKPDELNDREKRKKEVEEKLQVLNAKKHNLVQALKQILNVEEELKRRSSMGTASRPSVPLQVDVMNDSGSTVRLATPRMGSETNLGGDTEGGEAEDILNHNAPRYLHRMSSTSPSSESPLRRPPSIQHNMVTHPSRSSLGASPSRFAPTGNQSHPANLPTVSQSGTNYIASSPSPAASGGTSAFRDARQLSPWN